MTSSPKIRRPNNRTDPFENTRETEENSEMKQGYATFMDATKKTNTRSRLPIEFKHPVWANNYFDHIKKWTKTIFPDILYVTSRKTKAAMIDFVNGMFDEITELASEMFKTSNRTNLTEWDLQLAVRIILPKGLAKDAQIFAVNKLKTLRVN